LLLDQALSYDPTQIEQSRKLSAAFRVIQHDVERTDRQLAAFKRKDGAGLKMVTDLLQTYCIFNPPIGYLQGMNDLFVPILITYLPDWNEEGSPIDSAGNVIEYQRYLPTIFWCFDAMLRNLDHLALLGNVTGECRKLAHKVHEILLEVSPVSAIWMKRTGIHELLWMYSDFVLLFKRSFDGIWPVWLQLNCAQYPHHWLVYFVAAVIILAFGELTSIDDITVTALMEHFPRILKGISLQDIGVAAWWLADRVKHSDPPSESGDSQQKCTTFRFFETGWTTRTGS
jgi:hypothetical protein